MTRIFKGCTLTICAVLMLGGSFVPETISAQSSQVISCDIIQTHSDRAQELGREERYREAGSLMEQASRLRSDCATQGVGSCSITPAENLFFAGSAFYDDYMISGNIASYRRASSDITQSVHQLRALANEHCQEAARAYSDHVDPTGYVNASYIGPNNADVERFLASCGEKI